MYNLSEIIACGDDNEICKAILYYYDSIYNYLAKNKSILTSIFNIQDIRIGREDNWAYVVRENILEQLEVNIDDIMQNQTSGETSVSLQFKLVTDSISRLNDLLNKDGLTLLRGLEMLKKILDEHYNLGDGISLFVHIDSVISVDTREPVEYSLQVVISGW